MTSFNYAKTLIQLVPTVISLLLLSGCGSSDETVENTKSTTEVKFENTTNDTAIKQQTTIDSTESSTIVDDNNIEITNNEIVMDTLVADEGFTFINKKPIEVTLNFDEYHNKRAYISIYQQYKTIEDGRLFPVSNSRVLAGPLVQGKFNQAFTQLDNTQTYLVELWFYDGSHSIQNLISLSNNQLTW